MNLSLRLRISVNGIGNEINRRKTILKEFILWLSTSSLLPLDFMVPFPCIHVKRFNVCDVIMPGRSIMLDLELKWM